MVAVFKSLVLSHYRYGCVALDTCTQQAKADMQVIQNRMLRIIGLSRADALTKYGIQDVKDFIETACFDIIGSLERSLARAHIR